jgi:hypothetical protein
MMRDDATEERKYLLSIQFPIKSNEGNRNLHRGLRRLPPVHLQRLSYSEPASGALNHCQTFALDGPSNCATHSVQRDGTRNEVRLRNAT